MLANIKNVRKTFSKANMAISSANAVETSAKTLDIIEINILTM